MTFHSPLLRAFTPKQLFRAGEKGVWYDPSDMSTLWQDSARTTAVTAVEQPVGCIDDKSGNGANATQSTSASRPVLSARYNLLTYTEDFGNAVWATFGGGSKQGTVSTANPLGVTQNVNAIRVTTAGTGSNIYQNFTVTAGTYVFSCYVKRNAGSNQTFQLFQNIGGTTTSSGNLTATSDWQQFSLTATGVAGSSVFGIIGNTGGTQADLLVWGADLRYSNDALGTPAYQRVTTSTNYDDVGFTRYLKFDGTDDCLATSAIDFSGTNKVNVFAGLRKLSDANVSAVTELTTSVSTNNGAFGLFAPAGTNVAQYSFISKGTTQTDASATTYTAPITNIVSAQSDISSPVCTLRVNGSQVANSTSTQGTGNFSNAVLYVGSRGGSSFYLNGRLYSLIVRGASSTAGQITDTEGWVNGRTRAY